MIKYSIYLIILIACALSPSYCLVKLPRVVTDAMSTREMRYHHFLWHQIRNLWDRFDSNTKQSITNLGWAPPRPSQRYENGLSIPIEDNDSGEDFLYMHRHMINTVNDILGKNRLAKLTPWSSIPTPRSTSFPVPPNYTTSSSALTAQIAEFKSDAFYNDKLKPREDRFRDPKYLRTLTLGQLGSRVEFTIHNWLHSRFSGYNPLGYRNRNTVNPLPNVSKTWDNSTYNWLVDSYSSHVNEYFWKIHGWVDLTINAWMEANSVTEIQWKGTWIGGSFDKVPDLNKVGSNAKLRTLVEKESHGCSGEKKGDPMSLEVMEKVADILGKTGLEFHFYEEVVFEEDLAKNGEEKDQRKRMLRSM